MKHTYKSLLFWIALLVLGLSSNQEIQAQVNVTANDDADALIGLLVGEGITYSNATLNCASVAVGTFDSEGTDLGVDGGVAITTGLLTNMEGPSAGNSSSGNGFPGDGQLSAINGGTNYNDACILEFDVVPEGDLIAYNYIFGSEEYPEYVGSGFNDAFALFISGPGITGIQNMAVVPMTVPPVSVAINNVNAGSNSIYYNDNAGGTDLGYDGFTDVLQATAAVIPCEVYHLKFVVADGGDSAFDTGVMIEAGSLNANEVILSDPTSDVSINVDYAIENCANGIITFSIDFIPQLPFDVNYNFSGTATNGVDYIVGTTSPFFDPTYATFGPMTGTFTFPPGAPQVDLYIHPLTDDIVDGGEFITIEMLEVCPPFAPYTTATIFIQDDIEIDLPQSEYIVCPGEPTQMQVGIVGGNTDIPFTWSPAIGLDDPNSATPMVNVSANTTYTVTAGSGPCAKDTIVNVILSTALVDNNANVGSPFYSTCGTDPVQLSASGGVSYEWSPTDFIDNPTSATPNFIANSGAGDFNSLMVDIYDEYGCFLTFFTEILVNGSVAEAQASATVLCEGETVTLTAANDEANTYEWFNTNGDLISTEEEFMLTPTATDTYTLNAIEGDCVTTSLVQVEVNAGVVIAFDPPLPSICMGEEVTITATGASSISWYQGATLLEESATITLSPTENTVYTVVGGAGGDCQGEGQVTVEVDALPGIQVNSNNLTICNNGEGQVIVLDANAGDTYDWQPTEGVNYGNPDGTLVTLSPDAATTYEVTATSIDGCTQITSVDVDILPPVQLTTGGDQALCTNDDPVLLTVEGAIAYTWSPPQGLSSLEGDQVLAQPDETTTYTITGIDFMGCVGTTTIEVVVSEVPNISISEPITICEGQSVELEAFNASGQSAFFSWTESPPSGSLSSTIIFNPEVTPPETTTYTALVTTGVGCENIASVTVTVNEISVEVEADAMVVCPGGTVELTAFSETAATYFWSPTSSSAGLSSTSGAVVEASPTQTTTYTVTAADEVGCSRTADITIEVETPSMNINPSATVVCLGEEVTLQGFGADTYSWDIGGTETLTGNEVSFSPTESLTITGTGTLNAAGGGNCGAENTIDITVIDATINTVPASASVCPGSAAEIIVQGAPAGSTYEWVASDGSSSVTLVEADGSIASVSPSTETTYNITGTSPEGCEFTTNIVVGVNSELQLTINPELPQICSNGAPLEITVFGADDYTWTPADGLSATTGNTVEAFPATTTTYTINGSDANGCEGSITFDVVIDTPPELTVSNPATICGGTSSSLSVSVTNPIGEMTYAWSPAETLNDSTLAVPMATPNETTTYTVLVTDGNGCQTTGETILTVNAPALVLNADAMEVCIGDGTDLNAVSADAVAYEWSPADGLSATTGATVTAIPAETTTYTVVAEDAEGCSISQSVTIEVITSPLSISASQEVLCQGDAVVITAEGLDTYDWIDSYGVTFDPVAEITATPFNFLTTYTVTGDYTTPNGTTCTFTDSIELTTIGVFVVGPPVQTICPGTSIDLSVEGANTYAWGPAEGLSATFGSSVTATPDNTITYTVTGTGDNGCQGGTTVTIIIQDEVPLTPGQEDYAVCSDGTPIEISVSGAETYEWSPMDYILELDGGTATIAPPFGVTYTITGTDANGCTGFIDIPVEFLFPPAVDAGDPVFGCDGNAVQLEATGGVSYDWVANPALSATDIANPMASPTETSTFYVNITDVDGCTALDSVIVNMNFSPTIDAGVLGVVICAGDVVDLSAMADDFLNLSWSGGLGSFSDEADLNASYTAAPDEAGDVWLTLVASNNCGTVTDSVMLGVSPVFDELNAGEDMTINEGDSVLLVATGALEGFAAWDSSPFLSCTDCLTPMATPTVTTTFTINAGSVDCATFDEVTITVLEVVEPPVEVVTGIAIPTAFSPNGDGRNDNFTLVGQNFEIQLIKIYNRWGELVFETTDPTLTWDGTHNGELADVGSYVYYVEVLVAGEDVNQAIQGNVSVVR